MTLCLLVWFGNYADTKTPYMLHCHMLQHEDRGMMGQFVLVRPGEQPGAPSSSHPHGSAATVLIDATIIRATVTDRGGVRIWELHKRLHTYRILERVQGYLN